MSNMCVRSMCVVVLYDRHRRTACVRRIPTHTLSTMKCGHETFASVPKRIATRIRRYYFRICTLSSTPDLGSIALRVTRKKHHGYCLDPRVVKFTFFSPCRIKFHYELFFFFTLLVAFKSSHISNIVAQTAVI